jgi:hypothetical protein
MRDVQSLMFHSYTSAPANSIKHSPFEKLIAAQLLKKCHDLIEDSLVFSEDQNTGRTS